MPRIKREIGLNLKPRFPRLVARLANELTSGREFGQPMIDEGRFPRTDALRVNVIWDEWESVPFEERSATILQAYENAEGKEFRERVALASGFTVPEAYESGMLPYQVVPLVRKDDPVTLRQCIDVMVEEGASSLFDAERPQLRFGTCEDAEAAVKRLVARLPGSDMIWAISHEKGQIAQAELDRPCDRDG
ncbi:MAG TPA: hypothetical protein VMV69_03245 [Pirellulales bacterium]|nr:hypothetical protein [Pirellulales bacterium]